MQRTTPPLDTSILNSFPMPDVQQIDRLLTAELATQGKKIVVLDDDPTGVQTVHAVSVYTSWDEETLEAAFAEEKRLFFILTNSRGLVAEQTAQRAPANCPQPGLCFQQDRHRFYAHQPQRFDPARALSARTHTLKDQIEALSAVRFDGEVICPFFKEGGRFTLDDIHYVREGSQLTPAGQTEFARDKTFGYRSSHLGDWCEEKTGGAFQSQEMIYISLPDLRAVNIDSIESQLLSCTDFNKVIVNAIDTVDVKVFAIAFLRALAKGKNFILRSAAAIPKGAGRRARPAAVRAG
jgi:uncharacterized protein YgbK (DUF1537 family)